LFDGSYLVAIDGSEYFSSDNICCPHCLVTESKGKQRYHHQILQSVIVHPDMRQVLPLAPEPISNRDGTKKQDCERNAAKRLIPKIKATYPKLNIIVTADGLYSNQPFIIENETFNTLKNQGYHIEHNFGHGQQNLSMIFFVLNLLAFYVHQILELTDRLYHQVRYSKFTSRKEYWNQLRCTIRILIFPCWESLLTFILDPEKGIPP